MEPVEIVEILPMAIWIENGLFGSRRVMVQHQGHEPFAYAVFNYHYLYTSNSETLAAAEFLARSLGATDPIEMRATPLPSPDLEVLAKRS